MIPSFPSIYNVGHAAVATILHGPVRVSEKVDGSQVSFRVNELGDLEVRSKGAMVNTVLPEGMFKKAVEVLQGLHAEGRIPPGYIFRGEYLAKAQHNVAAYNRVPRNHIIIFAVEYGEQSFVDPTEMARMAAALDFEVVPELGRFGPDDLTLEQIRAFLDRESMLGGQRIEGIVINPLRYDLYGRDKKPLLAKFVSESFKETHAAEWKKEHGTKSGRDIIGELSVTYGTPARWQKAAIHLQEKGDIEFSPRDIGKLMAEVPVDIDKEEREAIKEALWKWAWPQVRRAVTRGLPAWWKDELLKRQFEPIAEELEAIREEASAGIDPGDLQPFIPHPEDSPPVTPPDTEPMGAAL